MRNGTTGLAAVGAMLWLGTVLPSFAVSQAGEAVVVSHVGLLQARVFTGAVHDGRTDVRELSDGSSVGENSRVMTGKESWACILLSPGPVLCVAPATELTILKLRHSSVGLPEKESDLVRRVHLELHKGRVLVHGSEAAPSMDIVVRVDAGEVQSSGGSFIVAQGEGQGEWAVISEDGEHAVVPANGARVVLPDAKAFKLVRKADGTGEVREIDELLLSPLRVFEVCHVFFDDLTTFVEEPGRFDRAGLGRYLGVPEGSIASTVSAEATVDVSPSAPLLLNVARTPGEASASAVGARGRWDERRIMDWYDQVGVIKGVNYVPANAVNSTDMWLEETFDAERIDKELDWARSAGYTALRVQLQYIVWRNDAKGFIDRLDQLLGIARRNNLRVVPVLFDDMNLAGSEPSFGPQPEPVDGKHNARWTPGPGAAAVSDRAAWPDLEKYVREVLGEFKRDDRIVFWDLYNRVGDASLGEASLPLAEQVFNWARDVNPAQPLAVAAWDRFGSAMSARMLERSDLITFQSFESPEQVESLLLLLRRYQRPMICSDWLMRQQGNNFETILPLFSLNRVGWFNRGLVHGKTQQWIQRDDRRSKTDDQVWQHDVLRANGDAYDPKEINLIQAFRFQERF
jgi:hypothetical protein